MRTWKTKNDEEKEYRTSLGTTDYNIPMFGYRSAFLILISTLSMLTMVAFVSGAWGVDGRGASVVLGGLAGGCSVAVSQFYIERKKGMCKSFWVVAGLLSLATGALIYLLYYAGIVL